MAPVKLRTRDTPPTSPAKHSSPVRAPERPSAPTRDARDARTQPANFRTQTRKHDQTKLFPIGMNRLARVGIWRRIELTPVMSAAVLTM